MMAERDVGGIRVVHAIPGRIRLKVAQVRENPALASEIQTRLAASRGIRQVEVNPLTGSVLVLYEAQNTASPDALGALAEPLTALFPGFELKDSAAWQPSSTNGASPAPSLTGGISSFFGALNTGVGKVTGGSADLKILVPLILLVLGVRGLLVSEKLVFPAWYDLFWFSLGTFFMLHPRPSEGRQYFSYFREDARGRRYPPVVFFLAVRRRRWDAVQIVPGQVSPTGSSSQSSLRCWVVHAIPGRLRFRMESRRLFADLAAAFETFLRDLPGIQDVRLNPTCRSVTLTYDPNLSRAETFLARVQALSLNQFSTSPA